MGGIQLGILLVTVRIQNRFYKIAGAVAENQNGNYTEQQCSRQRRTLTALFFFLLLFGVRFHFLHLFVRRFFHRLRQFFLFLPSALFLRTAFCFQNGGHLAGIVQLSGGIQIGDRLGHRSPFLLGNAQLELLGILEGFQIGQNLPCIGVTAGQIGIHCLHGDFFQLLGHILCEDRGRQSDGIDMLQGNRHRGITLKGQTAGDHLIHDHAQRVQVRAVVHMAALGLFGRNIVHRTDGLALAVGALLLGKVCDAEVGHLHRTVTEQHDVVRFDVPVNDVVIVSVLQCPGDLGGKNSHFFGRKLAAAAEIFLQRDAVNQLHNDVIHISGAGNIVNIDNVGMGQHGNRLGFIMELMAELQVRSKLSLEDLNRHIAIEPMALGFVDNGCAAYANDLQKLIAVIQHGSDIFIHSQHLL